MEVGSQIRQSPYLFDCGALLVGLPVLGVIAVGYLIPGNPMLPPRVPSSLGDKCCDQRGRSNIYLYPFLVCITSWKFILHLHFSMTWCDMTSHHYLMIRLDTMPYCWAGVQPVLGRNSHLCTFLMKMPSMCHEAWGLIDACCLKPENGDRW